MSRDAMSMIRSDLVKRIDGIAAVTGRLTLASLCEQVDAIRRIARQHRLDALEGLASMLETATAYHGHGPIIRSYLELMRDAAESEMQDAEVRATLVGALSLRLGA